MDSVTTIKPTVKSTFKNKDFSLLWIGQFVSNAGSAISFIVLPLFIFAYTNNVFWLGVITLMQLIPTLLFSPPAGMFVDTHNRKTIMISSDVLSALFILSVPVFITFDQVLPQIQVIAGVCALVFLGATVNRFFMPAREASIPHLVKKDELNIAIAISQTTFSLILAIGPIIGAVIATIAGFSFAFIIDGLTFLFSALTLFLIRTDLRPEVNSDKNIQEKPSLLLGTKKIFQIKTLRFIIIIFALLVFANASINSFLVAFTTSVMHMSKVQFGTSVSILGGSAVLTGIFLTAKITKVKRPIAVIAGSFFAGGIILSPVLIINQYWQLYIILFLMGPINVLINIPANVVFFRDTTDNIRGQVFSALDMLISLFTIVGILYGVFLVPYIGLRNLFFINALLFIAIGFMALFYLFFINNLDSAQEKQIVSTTEAVVTGD